MVPKKLLKSLEGSPFPPAINVREFVEDSGRTADRELVNRFRGGDREAFTTLYGAHHAAVFRFALYMTGNRERAGEVTQDVFVWLLHHPDSFDAERGTLPAFLGGVARQILRRRRQDELRWLPLDEQGLAGSVPHEIAGAEEIADLWKAIASLPERYRQAVILCDLEEMSNEHAAAVLGCAVGTVWSRLNRAHELLARKLQARDEKRRCST